MPRVKRGTHRIKRRKNILARTKGMMWGRKNRITLAKTAATKAGANAYRDRRLKKRDNRALQQIRINAAARLNGTTYSKLMHSLKERGSQLDRKVLAQIAKDHPAVFAKLVNAG
ncbi:MAG: 50S ribosomal protein L20 [Patescibacteria group bacterium]|nr:50S ribosomal protein L20 [Patescibacteria group bacterium]